MNGVEISCFAIFTLWVLVSLHKNFFNGVCQAVVFLICLPTYLRIILPQPLPALTIQRMILIMVVFYWFQQLWLRRQDIPAPLKGAFKFWMVSSGLAVVFTSVAFFTSIKDYLDAVFEVMVFYFVVASVVRDREKAVRLLRAVWIGFMVVAILGLIERYTKFNPVDSYISGYDRGKGYSDVNSTYPQRILFGAGMAMAFPIAYGLMILGKKRAQLPQWLLVLSAPLMLAACYFSMSRGPWLAAVVVGIALAVFGSKMIRSRLMIVGVLAGVVLLARPGVLGTLVGKAEETADVDSHKGGTFRYRLELWKVAWAQVTQSPVRLLAGYGLGAGRETELAVNLTYRDKEFVIDSWDNHFAYDLFQTGVLGLLASVILHCGAGLLLFKLWRESPPGDRDLLAACMASLIAILFMMTNVLIFAKQLNFAFWSVFAAGVAYSGYYGKQAGSSEDSETDEADEDVEAWDEAVDPK